MEGIEGGACKLGEGSTDTEAVIGGARSACVTSDSGKKLPLEAPARPPLPRPSLTLEVGCDC